MCSNAHCFRGEEALRGFGLSSHQETARSATFCFSSRVATTRFSDGACALRDASDAVTVRALRKTYSTSSKIAILLRVTLVKVAGGDRNKHWGEAVSQIPPPRPPNNRSTQRIEASTRPLVHATICNYAHCSLGEEAIR